MCREIEKKEMKLSLLYFTTAISDLSFQSIVRNSKIKPSQAPQVFESALIRGLAMDERIDLELHSFPMVALYPNSKLIFWANQIESISTLKSTRIPSVNLPILKQLFYGYFSRKILETWILKNNTKKKAVIIYSIYGPIAKQIISICKKYHIKCYAIVPDLPRDMYSNRKFGFVKTLISKLFIKDALKIQSEFDGYIYLTKMMDGIIGKGKPYMVLEGICDESFFLNSSNVIVRKNPKAIMYAGALNRKYRIENMLNAFMLLKGDFEFWICGNGDLEEKIKNFYTQKDLRIKYLGRLSREKVLKLERDASLLVNIRNVNDEFTMYSFPSKTIEYMASGTPLLTSRLKGIPLEYFDYLYTIEDDSVEGISRKMQQILNDPEASEKGARAKKYILENKTSYKQSKQMVSFILSQIES